MPEGYKGKDEESSGKTVCVSPSSHWNVDVPAMTSLVSGKLLFVSPR